MYEKTVRHTSLLIIVILLVPTSACMPSSPLTAKTPLTILGTLAATGMPEVSEARVVVSRNKHEVEETVPVVNNEFTATLQIPVGEWTVTVLLVDALGKVLFQSKPQTTQISMSDSQVLELVLQPADSTVHIEIDVENYIFKHVTMRARIHFDDEIHEVIRSDSLTPLATTLELTPGSYEFKIELYTDSFRIGDRLGPGAWEVIHINDNEELFINWSPVTEALHVSGRVETLLPAPENFVLTDAPEGVLLSWDPVVYGEIAGYFVFAQASPLERFELLNSQPLEEMSFLHVCDPSLIPETNYLVAAVSTSGLVGYYSAPQTWAP